MKILHLFGDWKWTGPAEPVVNLCFGLKQRGHEVILACQRFIPEQPQTIEKKARQRGLEVVTEWRLSKKANPLHFLRDLFAISDFLRQRQIEILHLHHTHDHIIGGMAVRLSRRPTGIVRTDHKGVPLRPGLGQKFLINHFTDALICLSEEGRLSALRDFSLRDGLIQRIEGAIDLERFTRKEDSPKARASLSRDEKEVVMGVVARIQRKRRFDLLLDAFREALNAFPSLRLLIVGRGTHMQEVAVEPVKRMGLSERVTFAGYREDDYVEMLSAMDMLVFLVPGSDGSCRTVREAMAMGIPVIATRRGLLPELIEDGENGLVIEENSQSLCQAMVTLARDEALRGKLGEGALRKAQSFSLHLQAEQVERLYEAVRGKSLSFKERKRFSP